MDTSIKIRATEKGGITDIKALISHPMETGQRKDPQTGKIVPAHFIKTVKATVQGKPVLLAHWGGGISKNPYIAFKVEGAKAGDTVVVTWEDNRGQSGTGEAVIR